jgi:Ferritin-like domain
MTSTGSSGRSEATNVGGISDAAGSVGKPISKAPCNQERQRRELMTKAKSNELEQNVSRDCLAELLNEDLSREYQAIISYVVYSLVLKGAEFMSIAEQLELHAQQELKHALIISRQIDYLGKMPAVTPKPGRKQRRCSVLIFRTKIKPSGIIGPGFGSAKRSANLPWRS